MAIQYEPGRLASGIPITSVSLHLNLFFLRIMKEHCVFLEAGFAPKDKSLALQAREMRENYDGLLRQAIVLANGVLSPKAIASQQFITPHTAQAERLTSYFTGIPIDSGLTVQEKGLTSGAGGVIPSAVDAKAKQLSDDAHRLTGRLADFKKKVLLDVVNCRAYTSNYPLELHHMYEEAALYLKMLEDLAANKNIMNVADLVDAELFWNKNMAQHAGFTAGKLDPSEESLIEKARMFANQFDRLVSSANAAREHPGQVQNTTNQSLAAAKQLQNFQTDGIKGMMDCKIQSIIPPLVADHHIRETSYFIWLLEMGQRVQF